MYGDEFREFVCGYWDLRVNKKHNGQKTTTTIIIILFWIRVQNHNSTQKQIITITGFIRTHLQLTSY